MGKKITWFLLGAVTSVVAYSIVKNIEENEQNWQEAWDESSGESVTPIN